MDHRFAARLSRTSNANRTLFSAVSIALVSLIGTWAINGASAQLDPSGEGQGRKPSEVAADSGVRGHRRSSDSAPASPQSAGPMLMRQVVISIQQHQTVSAEIRHRANLFGQKLVGSGQYLQQRSDRGLQVRLTLTATARDRTVRLVQVCDGRFLWTNDNLFGQRQLGRADVSRLRREAERLAVEPMPVLLGGGLASLLSSLEQNFVVAAPQPLTFQEIPMWALALRWKPQRIRTLVKQQDVVDEQDRVRIDRLPSHFPDRVFVFVGQDDLFPYRIDFRRTASESEGTSTEQNVSQSIAMMEMFEVRFNGAIDDRQFGYKPPADMRPEDLTEQMLAQLHASSRMQPTRSRSGANLR